jgi:tetratricopeptide (TPR) repeat protein
LHQFFEAVAEGRVQEFVSANYALLDIPFWVELILVLRYTEGLLLEVFEQRLALDWVTIRVHLTFVALWAELAYYLRALGSSLTVPTQQVCLQTLKDFASRPYFPLYGQNLVSLSGAALGEALTYLEEGLPSEDSPAMAKIYNLLGYALREAGALAGAIKFCTAGAELAHQQGDMATQAACLVNGGRALREEGRPREALALEEKALVLTRTAGHQLGEAYTLAALGRSLSSLYRYNEALEVLTQGLQRARDLREQPCIALCLLGLGGVYEATERYSEALAVLQEALATNSQDLGMVGRTLLAQAEVQKALQNYAQAVLSGAQAMLVLRSINSPRWRKAGGLLVVLRGQGGAERFEETLKTLGANAFEVQRLLGEFTQP